MRLGVASLAALAAFVAAGPAHASTPMPWCGTAPAGTDRLPDAAPGFAVHVAYVRPADAPDRFEQFAPRIVGDAAALDAWWRSQDSGRTLRFDLFPGACATAFGTLDITNVVLPQGIAGIGGAFSIIRQALATTAGFVETEKTYIAYYDGPTGQSGLERVCGQGAPSGAGSGLPGLAVIYLDSCRADTTDVTRPVIAVHELVHTFGAVDDQAPHICNDGHVCDVPNDLLAASLSGGELETHVLDGGRDDYYGHDGRWTDVRDSLYLERLDSPDRAAPTTPTGLVAREDPSGLVGFSWRTSSDDIGPVAYRVYQDGRFVRQVTGTSTLVTQVGATSLYAVRAVDAVGRLSQTASIRFDPDVGIVDEQGRLVRDTVRPPAILRVAVKRTAKTVVLSWPVVRDAGGVRSYRVKLGTRTVVVAKPAITLAKVNLRTAVSISAVDRAGNIGPAVTVPFSRLR